VCDHNVATIEITSTTFGHASLYNIIQIFTTMAYRDFLKTFFVCKITIDHPDSDSDSDTWIMIPNIH